LDPTSQQSLGKNMQMTLQEISDQSKIPVKVLKKMIGDGAFTDQMDEADQIFFDRLLRIINQRYFIRHCVLQVKSTDREAFIRSVHLETKWERYMFTYMINQYALGTKLQIDELVSRVKKVFRFDMNEKQIEMLRKIRNSIHKRQSRIKLKNENSL